MVTDKTRREAFITQNLGLVHACAGRFRGRGMEYDDLYSAGCVGLIKAYDNFDESRGVCFSTYAVPVILGEIKKLFRDGGTVKVSRSLKELGMRVQAAREHTMKLCGSEPTLQQLAEQLDEPIENVALAIQAPPYHKNRKAAQAMGYDNGYGARPDEHCLGSQSRLISANSSGSAASSA